MDLIISGNHCSIPCNTKRWDCSNYNIVLETWMIKSDLQNLRNSIVPGATKELYQIMGKPYFYDQTWQANNTIRVIPQANEGNLYNMRKEKTVFVKSITDSPCEGQMGKNGYLDVKMEFNISANSSIQSMIEMIGVN